MFNKKYLIIGGVIIGLIFIISVFAMFSSNGKVEYITHAVTKGTLTQTVEATGKIESVDQIELNFKRSGRISQITTKVGDEVVSGQILARLEARDLQSRVTDSQARLDQENADYNQLISGASIEDIQVTKDTVAQKEQDLLAAKNTLTNLKAKQEIEVLNLKETAITTLNNEIITAQSSIEEISNTLNNDDAEDVLSVKNTSYIQITKQNQADAQSAINAIEIIATPLYLASTDNEVEEALDQGRIMLNKVLVALSSTLDVLTATITSSDLTETELNALKTTIQSEQTTISASKTSLQTAKANWTNKVVYYQDQITTAEDNINQTESALQVTKSQLTLKESPPRDFEIDSQEASIKQARASLSLALANLNETIIKAPLNGIVTKKHFEVGEQTSLSSPVLEMIGESNLQIEVDIPESDISKINSEQEVVITFDAFSDEEKFSGQIIFVDPAETIIQDVVYYKVKVQLNEQYDQIKPGMTANVTILTNQKEDVIFVPFRAVKSTNGDKYVEILINNEPREQIVEIGLRGDEGIEIINGLQGGENVVTFVKEK